MIIMLLNCTFKNDSHESFMLFLNFPIQILLITGLKNIYKAPRPYWKNDDIDPKVCNVDFGNPSGHSISSSFYCVYIYFAYIHNL